MKGLGRGEVPKPSFKSEEGCLPRGLSAGDELGLCATERFSVPVGRFVLSVVEMWVMGFFWGALQKVVKFGSKDACARFACAPGWEVCVTTFGAGQCCETQSTALWRWIEFVGCAFLWSGGCMSGCVF